MEWSWIVATAVSVALLSYSLYQTERATVLVEETLSTSWDLLKERNERTATCSRLNRRLGATESALAKARRERDGQSKRAEFWRSEAKRLGWEPES
jgi:hypothetical protein